MKKLFFARCIPVFLLVTMLFSLCSCNLIIKMPFGTDYNASDSISIDPSYENFVTLNIKNFGMIVIELHPEAAPITVENFKRLVSEGFYDGLTFHRVADLTYTGGYIVQGGDPKGDGSGGSDTKIKGEFQTNGVDNPLKHIRGTVSMARSTDKNSASSQFFICTDILTHLDGYYATFGMVVEGMDVVDEIASVETDYHSRPITPVVIEWAKIGKPVTAQ